MIVNYECGCYGSGDNVTLNCPFHNKKIKHEKIYPAAKVRALVEAAKCALKSLGYEEKDALSSALAALEEP